MSVNGETRELPDGATLRDLLAALGLAERPVAAEVNGELVPRSRHAAHALREGDAVEVVTLVGGG